MDDTARKALLYTGLAVIGGSAAVAVTVALIRSTSQRGEGIRLKVRHEVDPSTRVLLAETNATAKKLAEQGLRVRLFGKPK
jgi:hypothetical protein